MNGCLDLAMMDLPEAIGQVLRQAVVGGRQTAIGGLPGHATLPLPSGADASVLILIDLSASQPHRSAQSRLQGSVLAQGATQENEMAGEPVHEHGKAVHELGKADAALPTAVPLATQQLVRQLADEGQVLACRVRGAGGLLAAACAMVFAKEVSGSAGSTGISLTLDMLTIDPASADWGDYKIRPEQVAVQRHEAVLAALFDEAPGLLLQVPRSQRNAVLGRLRGAGLSVGSHVVGGLDDSGLLQLFNDGRCIFQARREDLMAQTLRADKPSD